MIIAILDMLSGSIPITAKAHQGQVLTAGFGVLLLGLAGMAVAGGPRFPALG